MANDNVLAGIKCPKCQSEGPFTIVGTATFLNITDDGCSDFSGLEWNSESDITCDSCGQNGDISVFTVPEEGDEEDEIPQGEVIEMGSMEALLGELEE